MRLLTLGLTSSLEDQETHFSQDLPRLTCPARLHLPEYNSAEPRGVMRPGEPWHDLKVVVLEGGKYLGLARTDRNGGSLLMPSAPLGGVKGLMRRRKGT